MSSSPIQLVRVDPENDVEIAELRRQRVLCGWGGEYVDTWLAQIRAGDKNLFWVTPGSETFTIPEVEPLSLNPTQAGPPPPDPAFQPLGHVSLDWVDTSHDLSLANREEGLVTIANLFVLNSQQGRGLGRIIMDELEALASTPAFAAKFITLNTMTASNAQSKDFWAMIGVEYDPKARVNQHWYERRGYVAYKVEPRYKEKNRKGEEVLLDAVFLKKALPSSTA